MAVPDLLAEVRISEEDHIGVVQVSEGKGTITPYSNTVWKPAILLPCSADILLDCSHFSVEALKSLYGSHTLALILLATGEVDETNGLRFQRFRNLAAGETL